MKKTTIGKFIIYASDMLPEGCIFFVHPKDEQLLVEALELLKDLPKDPKTRRKVQNLIMSEMKSHLTKVENGNI